MIRVAAIGDVHFGTGSAGRLRPFLADIAQVADLYLLAGDLTTCGDPAEAAVLASELSGLEIPVVAVLGNHDYHTDRQEQIRQILERVGIVVLEGESVHFDIGGQEVAIVGAKGFGGGFAGACGSSFGEPEMKAFMRTTEQIAARLDKELSNLTAHHKIVLLHYAPINATLAGERPEIYPFLGSYLLAEPVDKHGADLILHGHAHHGQEKGETPGGIPVRNVAQPLVQRPYMLYVVGNSKRDHPESRYEHTLV
jgi:Icc-related predicted phosphoesterase